jgi:hypothetical protein
VAKPVERKCKRACIFRNIETRLRAAINAGWQTNPGQWCAPTFLFWIEDREMIGVRNEDPPEQLQRQDAIESLGA